MDHLASLIAANITFVGTHFALSHPLRTPLVKALGEKGFLGLYSLISLAALAWIVMAFRALGAGAELWDGKAHVPWAAASVLTIIAVALLAGSLRGNPALPETPIAAVRNAEARGVFAITRHPMMWAFALWALAHVLVAPNARTLITASSIGVLALLGAHLQDRKKRALLGDAWQAWEARTHFWPRWSALAQVPLVIWITALAAWLALTWTHGWLGSVPAGAWKWMA
jgi:uncharacterized membrane protein